ncbi:MAG: hypothetical protein AAGD38_11770 [Acidobacteriota bacterium]
MKRLLLVIMSLGLLLTGTPTSADMPATLGSLSTGHPFWVRADLVFQRSGEVESSLLDSSLSKTLEARLGLFTQGNCIDQKLLTVVNTNVPEVRWNSLEEAIDKTPNIIKGKVLDAAPGLLSESLGTLARLGEIEFLKKHPLLDASSEYFLHIATARFDVDGDTFCVEDPRLPDPPNIGDEVIVFPTYILHADTVTIQGLVIERIDGELETSSTLSYLTGSKSLLEVEATTKRLLTLTSFDEELQSRRTSFVATPSSSIAIENHSTSPRSSQ